jgi:CheY-like chemotaxis protein
MPKILVADDNEEQAIFLVELLKSERYLVDGTVSNWILLVLPLLKMAQRLLYCRRNLHC